MGVGRKGNRNSAAVQHGEQGIRGINPVKRFPGHAACIQLDNLAGTGNGFNGFHQFTAVPGIGFIKEMKYSVPFSYQIQVPDNVKVTTCNHFTDGVPVFLDRSFPVVREDVGKSFRHFFRGSVY
ncbi:MAG: hypothetical protein BWY20_00796 [Spirochaetes bacterium ADurb.Bin215]|nr:MAG: hypothetical protein BWY20_00796 [Spirochaetes bacterium ADurb.Bin215]